jgi:tetratricopeptide (TPR) repeat protein
MSKKKILIVVLASLALLAVILAGFGVAAYAVWTRLNQKRGAALTAPIEQSPAWDTPAVPIESVLLVLPIVWEDTGLLDAETSNLMRSHETMMLRSWPRNVMLISSDSVLEHTGDTSPYRADNLWQTSVDLESALISFTKPTHILSYKLERVGEDQVKFTASLNRGDEVWIHEDSAPATDMLPVIPRTLRWALEQGGIVTDPAVLALHDKLAGPSEFWSSDRTEEMKAVWTDAAHPWWDQNRATLDGEPILAHLRAYVAREQKDAITSSLLDPGPLPPTAPLIQQLIRARSLLTRGENGAGADQYRQIAATYPGAARWVEEYFKQPRERVRAMDRIADIDGWLARVPPSSYASWRHGLTHREASGEARGTGYSNTVTEAGWEGYHKHNAIAMTSFSRAIGSGGLLPRVANPYISLLFQNDEKDAAMGVHERTMAKWPESDSTWYSVAHFLMPRWYGGPGEAINLMNEGLKRSPKNGRMIELVIDFHFKEARADGDLYKAGATNFDLMKHYIGSDPAAKAQLEAVLALACQSDIQPRHRAIAFMMASNMQHYATCHELARLEPDLWERLEYVNYPNLYAEARRSICWTLNDAGNWEEAAKAIEWARGVDEPLMEKGERCGVVAFCYTFEPSALAAMARVAATKDPAEADKVREHAKESEGLSVMAGIAAYLANDIREKDLENIVALHTHPEYSKHAEVYEASALLYAAQGQVEKANADYFRAVEISAEDPYSSSNPWARAEVERLLGIATEPEPETPTTE